MKKVIESEVAGLKGGSNMMTIEPTFTVDILSMGIISKVTPTPVTRYGSVQAILAHYKESRYDPRRGGPAGAGSGRGADYPPTHRLTGRRGTFRYNPHRNSRSWRRRTVDPRPDEQDGRQGNQDLGRGRDRRTKPGKSTRMGECRSNRQEQGELFRRAIRRNANGDLSSRRLLATWGSGGSV